jgi:flagellar biosynthesis GTPase FlhF
LDNVKVADVVKRLELVSNVLKNREIPRQLAIVDLMLDKLGIASFFPTLAEATRSALESNQYMSTRIEDVLGKLRGSLEPSEKEKIDLVSDDEKKLDKTLETVKENLSEEARKEKALKEKRRELRDQETVVPEKAEVPKELEAPIPIEKLPAPKPAAPKPPAPTPIR